MGRPMSRKTITKTLVQDKEERQNKLPNIESHCDLKVADSFDRIPDTYWLKDAKRVRSKCKVATGRIEDLGKVENLDPDRKRINYTDQHDMEENVKQNDMSVAEEGELSGTDMSGTEEDDRSDVEEMVDFCFSDTRIPNAWQDKDIWRDEKRIEKVKLDSFIDVVPKFEIDNDDDDDDDDYPDLDSVMMDYYEDTEGFRTNEEMALKKIRMCENSIRAVKIIKSQLEIYDNEVFELEYQLQLKIDWINIKNQMVRKHLDEINWHMARFPKLFTFDDIGTTIVPKSEEQVMKEIDRLEKERRWLEKYIPILKKEEGVFKERGPYPDNFQLECGFISMAMEFLKRKYLKDFGEPFVFNYKMKTFPIKDSPIPYEHLRPCEASVVILDGDRKFRITEHLGKTEILPKLEESPNLESFADIPINKCSTGLEDVKANYKMDNLAIHRDKRMRPLNDCKDVGGIKLSYELKFDRQIFLDNISKNKSGNTTSSNLEDNASSVYSEGSSYDIWMETKSLEPDVVRAEDFNGRVFTNYKDYLHATSEAENEDVMYVSNGYYEEEVIGPEESEEGNDKTECETVPRPKLRKDIVAKSASFESVLDCYGFAKQSEKGRRISLRDWTVSGVIAYLNDDNGTAVNQHNDNETVQKAICFEVEIGDQKKLARKPKLSSVKTRKKLDSATKDDEKRTTVNQHNNETVPKAICFEVEMCDQKKLVRKPKLFSDKSRKKLDSSMKDDQKKIKATSAISTNDVKLSKSVPNKHTKSAITTKNVKVRKSVTNKHANIGFLKSTTVIRGHRDTPVIRGRRDTPVTRCRKETPVIRGRRDTPVTRCRRDTPVIRDNRDTPGELELSKNRLQNVEENGCKVLEKNGADNQNNIDHLKWIKRFRFSHLHNNASISTKIPIRIGQKKVGGESKNADSVKHFQGVVNKNYGNRTERGRFRSRIPVRKKGFVWKDSEKVKSAPSLGKQSNIRSRIPIRIRSEYNANAKTSNTVVDVTNVKKRKNQQGYKNVVSRSKIPIKVKGYAWNRGDKRGCDEKQKEIGYKRQVAPLSKIPIQHDKIKDKKKKQRNADQKQQMHTINKKGVKLNASPINNDSAKMANNRVETRKVCMDASQTSKVKAKDRVEQIRPYSVASGLLKNRNLNFPLIKRIRTPELLRPLSAMRGHTLLGKSPLPPIGNKNGVVDPLGERSKQPLPPVKVKNRLDGRPMSAPSSRRFIVMDTLPPIPRQIGNEQGNRHYSVSPGG